MKSKNRSPQGIKTNERDERILLSLFRNKLLSLKQIKEMFFPETGQAISNRRMRKLLGAGFVERKVLSIKARDLATYSISKQGIKLIQNLLPEEITEERYHSDSNLHDLDLADVTHYLSSFSAVEKIHYEAELQSCKGYQENDIFRPFVNIRCDRVLEIQGESGVNKVAFEYERSLKGESRNINKFSSYYNKSGIIGVFYICSNDAIIKSLMNIDKQVCDREKSKIYFSHIKNAQEDSKVCTFQRFDGKVLKLKK